VRVEPWLGDDDAAWDALCERGGDAFQTSAVTRAAAAFGAATLRIRVLDDAGTPVVALAVVEGGVGRGDAARRALLRRFHVQGGPVVLDSARPYAQVADFALRGLLDLARSRGSVETAWRPTWPAAAAQVPFVAHGFDVTNSRVAWRSLPPHRDDVLPTLSRVHRKAVRKAEREGVTVRDARWHDDVLPLVERSFVRAGLAPRDRGFLGALHAGFSERGAALCLVAERGGEPIAGVFAVRCGDAVFNLFHGRTDGDTAGASNLLHLRLFERGVELGCTRVHTGDAGDAGIERFKRHLGFAIEDCPSASIVHRPVTRHVRDAVLSVYRLLRGVPA
jgi:hypothetical protein